MDLHHLTFKRIELLQVAMEPRRPLVAAHGTIAERPIVLVRAWDPDGASGWGECVAFPEPGYLTETVDSAWSVLMGIVPRILGRRFASPDDLAEFLAAGAPQAPVATAAVEMAAWDLVARRQGRSLANLLGGIREQVASGITIGLDTPDLPTAIGDARLAGYSRVKVKVEPGTALTAAAEAVRAAQTTPVVVDANASYSPGDLPRLRELDALGLAWIEQPFPAASLSANAGLRDSLLTPVALDESVASVNAVRRIIALEAAQALSIKPGRLGGLAAARSAYQMARRAGLSMWIGGMLETGIGRAHNLALASLIGFDVPGDMGPSDAYWQRDLLVEPITMTSGHIAVPTGHGIGVEVDVDYVTTLTMRRELFVA